MQFYKQENRQLSQKCNPITMKNLLKYVGIVNIIYIMLMLFISII
jgi:hypothetical protein